MKRPLTAFSEQRKAQLRPREAPLPVVLRSRTNTASSARREPEARPTRRVFTGEPPVEEQGPLLVQRISSSAPPPPPPFDEAGEEAARRHCVFFHNAPTRANEAMLKRFFERAGSVRRLRIFQENGQSRGMGLCEYMTPEAALAAAHILDGEKLRPEEGVDSLAAKRRRNTGERAIRVQRHKQRSDTREGGEASKDALSEASVPGELSVPADGPRLRPVLVASTEESGSGAMKVTRPPIPPPRPRREEVSGPEEEMMAPKVLSPTAAEDGKISFYSMAKKPEIMKVEASSEHTASKSSDEADDPDEESDFSDLEVDIKTEMPKDDETQDQGARKEKDHADEQPAPSSTRDQDMPKEEQASEPRDRGSESEKEEDFSCVYFHNVPFEVYEEDLLPLFERAGAVRAMRLFRKSDGRSRGQGLCQFTSSGAASKAVQILAGCFLANPLNETSKDSRELFVKIHQGSVIK